MICSKLLQDDSKALACLRKAIPDWDERIEKERLKQTVKESPVLADHGGDRKSEEQNQGAINTLKRGSTNSTYLTARLKRDAPEIADRLERGEFKSVRAAAIEAGIVKAPDLLDQAKRVFLKLSDLDRNEFLSWVYGLASGECWLQTSKPGAIAGTAKAVDVLSETVSDRASVP